MSNNAMVRYLTPEEMKVLLGSAKAMSDPLAQRDWHWMSALYLSGMRVKEFSLLDVGRVQEALRSKYLFIPREHRKGQRTDHKVFVTDSLRFHLLALLNFHGDHRDQEAPLVFSSRGARMAVRTYQDRVRHWAAVAGLPMAVSPHWFRHTRAMDIMRRSAAHDPRGVVKAVLGHASLASTGIYTAPAREDIESALESLDTPKRPTLKSLRKQYQGRKTA